MFRLPAYGIASSVGLLVAADAVPVGPSQFVQGGALALLGWFVWYLLTRTFPAHTKALEAARKDYTAALEATREDHREECRAQQQEFREAIASLAQAIEKRSE